jgi:signal transduction histidine kinase
MPVFKAIARSVRYKFALMVLAASCAALLVAGAALVYYELRNYHQAWVGDLTTQAELLGRMSAPALAFDDPRTINENLALLKSRQRILAAAVYDTRGKLVGSYRSPARPDAQIPELPEANEGSRVESNELVIFKRVIENKEIVGTVYLRTRYGLMARLGDYLSILAGVMGMSLLVALLVSAWLQTALTRPILAITQVARQVMERRDFSLRVKKSTEDEIGYLVDAFNDMLAELGRRADTIDAAQRSLEHEIEQRQRVDDDLRRLNSELEQRVADRTAQLEAANKELEGFSYSVSHDLRTPLRSVVGFAEALLEDHGRELSDEARRKVNVVHGEGRRMGVLIDDLLAFSRLGRKTLQTTEVNMGALARTTWNALMAQRDATAAEIDIGALPAAQGDRALLGQVFVNLLSNALKFSAKAAHPSISVSAISDAREHIYFVRDNGAGFNPKYRDKLFGVFQRLHDASEYPGTGVGLALVQRIVVRHGGRVWAEGQPGEGATFYFTLPRSDGPKERSDELV